MAGFEHLAAAQGPYLSRAFNALTSHFAAHKLPPRRHYAGVVGMVLKRQMLAIHADETATGQALEALAQVKRRRGYRDM
jgi:hypothetical protein